MKPNCNSDETQTIAVVGASARAAAFSLLRAGYKVVAADLFADVDLAGHCPVTRITDYPQGFVPWLAETVCDSWLYTGALENYPTLVDELATLRRLEGNSGEGLRRVRDPLDLQSVLHQAGFLFPQTITADDGLLRKGSWLGKTYQGSSGCGVGTSGKAPYYQQFVSGIPLSAVFQGCALQGVTRQLVGETCAGAAPFQYCGTISPWPISHEAQHYLQRLGTLLSEEYHLVGYYGVDLIAHEGQLWIIEINPRYTAAVEIVQQACEDVGSCFGKMILYAESPLTVEASMRDQCLSKSGCYSWPTMADIPAAGSQIAEGHPILTIFAKGESPVDVHVELQKNRDPVMMMMMMYSYRVNVKTGDTCCI